MLKFLSKNHNEDDKLEKMVEKDFDYILELLEKRRDQISMRSSVALAASTALFVVELQFVFEIWDFSDFMKYRLVILLNILSLILFVLSILSSFNLIKKVKRKFKSQKNVFYFGWISSFKNAKNLIDEFKNLNCDENQNLKAIQAISLSDMLVYRYRQLELMYKFFRFGMVLFMCSIIYAYVIKFNIIFLMK